MIGTVISDILDGGTLLSESKADVCEIDLADTEKPAVRLSTKTTRSLRWSESATSRFYEVLERCGSDFTAMQCMMDGYTRRELVLKFQREQRRNPFAVVAALQHSAERPTTEDLHEVRYPAVQRPSSYVKTASSNEDALAAVDRAFSSDSESVKRPEPVQPPPAKRRPPMTLPRFATPAALHSSDSLLKAACSDAALFTPSPCVPDGVAVAG